AKIRPAPTSNPASLTLILSHLPAFKFLTLLVLRTSTVSDFLFSFVQDNASKILLERDVWYPIWYLKF
ncbi:MAG: hypothetical protein N2234_08320, partial [Planctomycetota bacterium]|nr:hypothetical protein [Planctomycetota bacterium]